MKYLFTFFFLIIHSLHARAEVTSTELFNIINERLSYMDDVALFKAQKLLPIENLKREKTVLNQAKKSAHIQGLDPNHVEEFFSVQIAVAKAIQYRYRADLLSQPSVEKPKDLLKEVRPALLDLGDQIIKHIVEYLKTHGSIKSSLFPEFDTAIKIKYLKTSEKKLLFEALQKVKVLELK